MAGRPRGTSFGYPQIDYHFRLSVQAHSLLRDMAAELDATLKECLLATLLQTLDPQKVCPDWQNIPENLQ